ncbi:glycosyl transferase family 25 [Fadolivirus algeromassiliense]|jgi:glycosyl transferase family 25|uniref:Glycosyl transferase family 25 n=1 Tax=Fadolivirus FV1/VV64 TaxID=3070911 RepID=A0A7D3V7J3_9VIRU|nr:glycosyl transferase family 25 [Fadolivirus algeromassiliense]QKF93916.1 glycosyl transferase family 25 [Fadolivirus FV1/VV64]
MFNKILYINLKHRTDRNNNVISQLKKVTLLEKAERVDAIYGADLNINEISPQLITKQGKEDALNDKQRVYTYLTVGGIGCALSHRKTYQKIIDDNISAALILEDDITIDDNFNENLNLLQNKIPNDYDILFLGYHDTSIKYLNKSNNAFYTKPNKLYGLFGYIVTNKGARKLLNIFPITNQIDSEIPNHFNEILAYAVKPEYRLIFSDQSSIYTKFGTDIQIRKNKKECDNSILHVLLFIIVGANIFLLIMFYLMYKYLKNMYTNH